MRFPCILILTLGTNTRVGWHLAKLNKFCVTGDISKGYGLAAFFQPAGWTCAETDEEGALCHKLAEEALDNPPLSLTFQ